MTPSAQRRITTMNKEPLFGPEKRDITDSAWPAKG